MGLYIFFFSFALRHRLNLPFYFENIIFPEVVCTVIFSLPLFRIQTFLIEKLTSLEAKRGSRF
ncbi:hypothetical protein P261_00707 [Lachnospiraceae bacterium TWA4]|nr:hypothetical protein P261_00707 [Lachnospiraceae bacterium TWA4]